MADRAVNFDIKVRAIDEASNVFQKIGSNLKKETSGSFKNASDTLSQKGIKGVNGGADSGKFKLNFEEAVYRGMSRALKESNKIFGRGGFGGGRGGYGGGGESDSQRMGGIVGSIGKVFDKIGAAIGSLKIMGNSVGLIPSLPFRAIGMFGGLAKGALNMVSSVGQDYQQRIMEQAPLSGVKGIGIVRRAVGGGFTETKVSGGGQIGDIENFYNQQKNLAEAQKEQKPLTKNQQLLKQEFTKRGSPIFSIKGQTDEQIENQRFDVMQELLDKRRQRMVEFETRKARGDVLRGGAGAYNQEDVLTQYLRKKGMTPLAESLERSKFQGEEKLKSAIDSAQEVIEFDRKYKNTGMKLGVGQGLSKSDSQTQKRGELFTPFYTTRRTEGQTPIDKKTGRRMSRFDLDKEMEALHKSKYQFRSRDVSTGEGAWQTYGGANQFKQETGNFNVDYRLSALRGKFDFNYSRYGLNASGLQRALFARQRAGGAMTRLGTGEDSELALTRYLGYGMSTGIGAEQGAYLGGQFERYQLGQAQFGKQGTKLGGGVESAQANFRAAAVYGRQAGYTGAANPEFLTQMIQAVKSGVEKGMVVSGGVIAKQAAHFAVIAKESGMGKEAGMTMMSSISAAGESASKLGGDPFSNLLFQAVYEKMKGKTESEKITNAQLFLENPENNVLKMQYLSEFSKKNLNMSDKEIQLQAQQGMNLGVRQSALASGYRIGEGGELKYDQSIFKTRPLRQGIGEEYSEIDAESAQRILTKQNQQEAYKLRRGGVVEKMSDMELQVSETMLRLLNNFEQPIQKIVGVLGSFISKMSEVVQYLGNASEKLMGGGGSIKNGGEGAVISDGSSIPAEMAKQMSKRK